MISQCLIRGNGETEGVRSIQQAKPLTEQSALMLLSGLEPINTKGKNPKHTKKKKNEGRRADSRRGSMLRKHHKVMRNNWELS